MACGTVEQDSSIRWLELPRTFFIPRAAFHLSLNPATQSNASPSLFTPPCGHPSSKPTNAAPKHSFVAGKNQIRVCGFEKSSLLKNRVREASFSTKIVHARTVESEETK